MQSYKQSVHSGRKYVKVEWSKQEDEMMEKLILSKFSKKQNWCEIARILNEKYHKQEMNEGFKTFEISLVELKRRGITTNNLQKVRLCFKQVASRLQNYVSQIQQWINNNKDKRYVEKGRKLRDKRIHRERKRAKKMEEAQRCIMFSYECDVNKKDC